MKKIYSEEDGFTVLELVIGGIAIIILGAIIFYVYG